MADLPEYKRQVGITPAADASGIFETYSNVGKAIASKGEAYNVIGEFGAQISQNAANERARIAGVEAAKTPGRKLLPAITQTDKQFVDAYRQEEGNLLQYQGNQTLRKLHEELIKNPHLGASSLDEFEKNAKRSIQDTLSLSDEKNLPNLERALGSTYEGYYYELANRVEGENRRFINENHQAITEQTYEKMDDSNRTGNTDSAKEAFIKAKSLIDQEAARENWPEAKIMSAYEKLYEKNEQSKKQGEYARATEQEKPKIIEKLVTEPNDNLGPSAQDRVTAGVLQFANQHDAALKGQQSVNYLNLQALQAQGKLTQGIANDAMNNGDISAIQMAQLGLKASKQNTAQSKLVTESQGIIENFNNAVFLADKTPAPINYAVDKVFIPLSEQQKGSPLSLMEQATLLQSFKAPAESLQKRLSAGLNNGTPEQRMDAAKAISYAQEFNPVLVRGMNKIDKAHAGMINANANNPIYQTPEGQEKLKEQMYAVDEKTKLERQSRLKSYISDARLNDYGALKTATVKALGLKKGSKLPAGLTTTYMNTLRESFAGVDDRNVAIEQANLQMKEYYAQDSDKRVKFMPPKHLYTDLGYLLENDKKKAIHGMVQHNQQSKAENNFTYNDLAWPDAPNFEHSDKGPLGDDTTYINVDGKRREIVIDSDLTTQMSDMNDISWAIGYIGASGIFMPLVNPGSIDGIYRYRADKDFLNRSQGDPNVMQRVIQHEIKQNQNETVDDILSKNFGIKKRTSPNTESYKQGQLEKAHQAIENDLTAKEKMVEAWEGYGQI